MAGHVRKRSNGRWQARFPIGGRGGGFRSKTFDRKIDAERWLTSQDSSRNRGDWVDPALASETFGATAQSWLSSRRDVADSTRARDESYLRSLILPYIGDLGDAANLAYTLFHTNQATTEEDPCLDRIDTD